MGHILCDKHGGQGIEFACPHVAEAVRADASCGDVQLRIYSLADDPELAGVEDACWYCRTCIDEHQLPPDRTKITSAFWEALASLHRPICFHCLRLWEAAHRHAR